FTEQELEIWRDRAKNGPYKVSGDVSTNSPGDWERIVKEAGKFMLNPAADRWKGEGDLNSCVQQWSYEPFLEGNGLKHAAFVFLITGKEAYRDAVLKELLAQVSEPLTDFSNTRHWCDGVLKDINPSFFITEWLARLLHAYDYIRSTISDQDRQLIENWFKDAALFFQRNLDEMQIYYFYGSHEKRAQELVEMWDPFKTIEEISHYNGWPIPMIARCWNNRKGNQARYVGLAGVLLEEESLIKSAKLYFKEWIKYSVFPDGTIGEMERWTKENPDLGWCYAGETITQMVEIADALARKGDNSLYEFSTSEGYPGTALVGGNKSLLLAIKAFLKYMDQSWKPLRYATVNFHQKGNEDYLINGYNPLNGWDGIQDIYFTQANVYYQDEYINEVYTRRAARVREYPKRPPYPHELTWEGSGHIFPGKLFMFGQMEGKVWPFGEKRENN
ncbi:hypothetical protein, partial [Xanthovirga aplysinae]|uniref:hypothetical protein n=1 Tax=Xanthovirga aplysinae TaxID=2529853 RepID=UPI0016574D2A